MTAATCAHYIVRIDTKHTVSMPFAFFIALDRAARAVGLKDGRVAIREAAQGVDWQAAGSKSAMVRERAARRLGLSC